MELFSSSTKKPPLELHNTLSGKRECFEPLNHAVKMYNCGPTPYDEQHIGNLFPPVIVNVLRRVLEAWGWEVKQVTNITDFGHLSGDNSGDADTGEDKMTLGLRREGLALTLENMSALAEKYAKIFLEDIESLGVDTSKIQFPRASQYLREQTALIEALEQKGYAYRIEDGVYFDTGKFKGYGKLGGINRTALQEGARVAVNAQKKNPHDFALWKLDRKLGWPSPWGQGFPGWHIECTAMVFTLLGKQIDIHTGGIEHIPIHHNNEIAQAEALTHKQYVRYWLHNAHITIEGKKISKSLGNTVYLHNLRDRGLEPMALRYWFLTGHYRTPMNFTWDAIEGADTALLRLSRSYLERPEGEPQESFLRDFYTAVGNDLGTAQALALLWERLESLTKGTLRVVDAILGLGLSAERPSARLKVIPLEELPEEVRRLLEERETARQQKEYERADTLRAQIEWLGYVLRDTPEGPHISKK